MAQSMDVFVPDVLPICPGVSEFLVQRETRNAIIKFCQESRVFRRDLDPVSLVANIYEYEIEVPAGTTIVEIETMTYKGTPLDPRTLKEVEDRTTDWREQTGPTRYYIRRPDNLMWLVPVPGSSEVSAVDINVSLKPTRSSVSFDDELYEDYFEPILNLVLSRILRIPGKDWTDKRSANEYLAIYEQELQNARVRGRKAQRGAAPTVKYGGISSSRAKDDYGQRF